MAGPCSTQTCIRASAGLGLGVSLGVLGFGFRGIGLSVSGCGFYADLAMELSYVILGILRRSSGFAAPFNGAVPLETL